MWFFYVFFLYLFNHPASFQGPSPGADPSPSQRSHRKAALSEGVLGSHRYVSAAQRASGVEVLKERVRERFGSARSGRGSACGRCGGPCGRARDDAPRRGRVPRVEVQGRRRAAQLGGLWLFHRRPGETEKEDPFCLVGTRGDRDIFGKEELGRTKKVRKHPKLKWDFLNQQESCQCGLDGGPWSVSLFPPGGCCLGGLSYVGVLMCLIETQFQPVRPAGSCSPLFALSLSVSLRTL